MIRKSVLLLLLTWATSILCYSQSTSKNLEKALKQLGLNTKDCFTELVVEKILPFAKEKSVLVIPKIMEQEEDNVVLNSYILVINNRTGEIINNYYENDSWTSDALRLETIEVDTAPYILNSTTRAFGVRVQYGGSSRPNPYGEHHLSLFIVKSNKLVKVLNDFTVYSMHGEWDTYCSGEFVTESKVLVLSKNVTNNFRDIIVKNKTTTTTNTPKGEDCVEEAKEVTTTQILHFSEGSYR